MVTLCISWCLTRFLFRPFRDRANDNKLMEIIALNPVAMINDLLYAFLSMHVARLTAACMATAWFLHPDLIFTARAVENPRYGSNCP